MKRYIIKTPNNCSFDKTEIFNFYKNISFREALLEIILQKIFQFVGLGVTPNKRQSVGVKIWFFQIWVQINCAEEPFIKTESVDGIYCANHNNLKGFEHL